VPLLSAVDRAGLAALAQQVGWPAALWIGASLRLAQARGAPFADLPAATDDAERGSRAQAGSAILLFRALADRVDDPLAVTAKVIEASALAFLSATIGSLDLGGAGDRRAQVSAAIGRFPNVTARIDEAAADRVAFTVTACRLVALARHAGHPELAPLFCRADARWFGEVQPGVRLERPTTIAGGDAVCGFRIVRAAAATASDDEGSG
jgi:predicted ArsR family transcriptional regulator